MQRGTPEARSSTRTTSAPAGVTRSRWRRRSRENQAGRTRCAWRSRETSPLSTGPRRTRKTLSRLTWPKSIALSALSVHRDPDGNLGGTGQLLDDA